MASIQIILIEEQSKFDILLVVDSNICKFHSASPVHWISEALKNKPIVSEIQNKFVESHS